MCTAISDDGAGRHLFGRTLDLERGLGERIVLTPRGYRWELLHEPTLTGQGALLGVALLRGGVPLYYDATNEAGLAIAGLNFAGCAVYRPARQGMHNVASFELIPWLLSRCENVRDARQLLRRTNITPDGFASDLPATPLHWLIADGRGALVAEPTAEGLALYDAPLGVLTNAPGMEYHMTHLSHFMQLGAQPPVNRLCPGVPLAPYCRGMGAMGLPGDFSSPSRFVRAAFARQHTVAGGEGGGAIGRFFHIADAVAQPRGCALTERGEPVYSVYTSCYDTAAFACYFTTYGCRRIRRVTGRTDAARGSELRMWSMQSDEDVLELR